MFSAIRTKHSELLRRAWRVFKFGTVGVSGVIVNSGLLFLLTEKSNLDYKISAIIAIEISITNNFLWNTLWTWSDKKVSSQKTTFDRFLKFQISAALIALTNYGALIGFTELLHFPYLLSNIIGIGIGSSLNFFIGHFWVFRREKGAMLQEKNAL